MKFLIELTDLFCGEPNFSWVDRYYVEANTVGQAMDKFKKYHNADWILYVQNSEYSQFISDNNTCVFIVAEGNEDLAKYKQLD
jgi:hypothetical protein